MVRSAIAHEELVQRLAYAIGHRMPLHLFWHSPDRPLQQAEGLITWDEFSDRRNPGLGRIGTKEQPEQALALVNHIWRIQEAGQDGAAVWERQRS